MTQSLRVGLVLDDGLDSPDGVQQYMLTVGAWLRNRGHSVFFITGETVRSDISGLRSLGKNIHVKFNGNRMSIPLPVRKRHINSVLAELRLDIMHVQAPYSPFLGGRMIAAAHSGTAVVGTFHILPYTSSVRLANRVLASLNHKTGKRIDSMMAVSVPAADFAYRVYGYRATIVPNPFDFKRFAQARNDVATLQIVFLGRLVERKGAMLLLRAVSYLKSHRLSDADFVVRIGGRGPLLDQLRRFAADEDMESYVQFDGFIPESDKADYLAGADIIALPSISGESFGISVLEALAAARGVVLAGKNPGYESVMVGFENQLVTPGHTAAFAELIALYLNDSAARLATATKQKKYAAKFDINAIGPQIEHCYTSALRKKRQP